MRILSIETSCDETAIAVLDISGGTQAPKIKKLAHSVASQIELHQKYGGVFPMMAKREHSKNFVPLLLETLSEAKILQKKNSQLATSDTKKLGKILEREPELLVELLKMLPTIKTPKFDCIAVTTGPGLEPALWVGINAARALATYWDIPLVPVNHMEGHILSVLLQQSKITSAKIQFPALALLVSGGHTELVLMKDWMHYKKIGQTRDDAAGEAFDKVARMLDLPYPGGPRISKLAEEHRGKIEIPKKYTLPRPMLHSDNFDFSFSGLKTAVLYMLREIPKKTDLIKKHIAHEFENAVVEVLTHKTLRALEKYKAATLIVGGGVAANKHLRTILTHTVTELMPQTQIYFPDKELTTDNALMIGIAGYFQFLKKKKKGTRESALKAVGNLEL